MTMTTEKPTLWHCHDTRSLRPLWTLEELGLDYDVVSMQFPPRYFEPGFKELNVLGTVPYFVDGATHMTESSGICHYLVERYAEQAEALGLSLKPDNPEFGDYLNWLYHSDATLLFPQTLVIRYTQFEPEERRSPQVAEDYRKWYHARLRKLDAHIKDRTYLVADRFTIADIAVGYALYFGESQGLDKDYTPQVKAYLARLKERVALNRIQALGEELSPFLHPELLSGPAKK